MQFAAEYHEFNDNRLLECLAFMHVRTYFYSKVLWLASNKVTNNLSRDRSSCWFCECVYK